MVRQTVKMTKALGLCGTCRNISECTHFARRGAAHCCELFENEVVETAVQKWVDDSPPPKDFVLESDVPRKGLCMNCEHRESCSHSNTPEGIWHCEEYE